jgi:hypothetical protein
LAAAAPIAPETEFVEPDVADVLSALAVELCALAALAVVEVESLVSVELIEISCSRLFTFTNWLMYSLGSVFAVGSWFFISVTNNVKKSLAEMLDAELLLLLELLVALAVALVPLVPLAVAAMGFATEPVRVCAAVVW